MTSTPKPTDWHVSPAGPKGKCPICGISGTHKPTREHRATSESEKYTRRYLRRIRRIIGGVYVTDTREVGPSWKSTRKGFLHTKPRKGGPTSKTKRRITQACSLLSKGETLADVATILNTTARTLCALRSHHAELWEAALVQAASVRAPLPVVVENTLPDPQGMTLLEFLDQIYVPSRPDLSANGVYQFQVAIRRFNAWAGRPVAIDELTDEMLCSFLADRQRGGCSAATVNSNRSKLLTLWNCAWKKRLHAEQPRDVPRRREPQRVPEAWTKAEMFQLLDHIQRLNGSINLIPRCDWWLSLIRTIWDTSARVGAIRGATPKDLNLTDKRILLRAEEQKQNADQIFRLSDSTVETLKRIYDASRPVIWPWPYCHRQLWVRFRRIVEGAGLTAGKTHDLFHRIRRSSLSAIAVHDLELARQQAGHSTARLTQKHYIDPRIAHQRSAIDVLPELSLSGNGKGGQAS